MNELIHVAAVAVAAFEALYRGNIHENREEKP